MKMLVKNWMTKEVITIDPDDSMQHAMTLMKERKIRMLPVVQRGKLVGIVSDTDLKRASASDATVLDVHEMLYLLSKIKIRDIMTREPLTVHPDLTVEETAQFLLEHKISGAPVVDENAKVVGVITRDDLFKVLIALSGLGNHGIQFAFQIEDRPGSIKELADIIREHGGRIASILTSYARVPEGYRNVYLRIYDLPREVLPALQAQLKEQAKMLYVVDHRENRREIHHDTAGA
jgi:acetoin utilization protein AcuB